MPCYDAQAHRRTDASVEREEQIQNGIIQSLRMRCDKLTDLLCQAGRARHKKTEIPGAVLDWWAEHCKLDAARGEPW